MDYKGFRQEEGTGVTPHHYAHSKTQWKEAVTNNGRNSGTIEDCKINKYMLPKPCGRICNGLIKLKVNFGE